MWILENDSFWIFWKLSWFLTKWNFERTSNSEQNEHWKQTLATSDVFDRGFHPLSTHCHLDWLFPHWLVQHLRNTSGLTLSWFMRRRHRDCSWTKEEYGLVSIWSVSSVNGGNGMEGWPQILGNTPRVSVLQFLENLMSLGRCNTD